MRARDAGSTATAPPAVSLDAELVDVDGVTPGSDARVRVTASLAPDASRAARLRGVDLAWHGVERLDPAWVRSPPPAKRAGAETLAPGERVVARSPAIPVVTPDERVSLRPSRDGEDATASAASLARVVTIRLPHGLPPTFRGAIARYRYHVTVRAEVLDDAPPRDGGGGPPTDPDPERPPEPFSEEEAEDERARRTRVVTRVLPLRVRSGPAEPPARPETYPGEHHPPGFEPDADASGDGDETHWLRDAAAAAAAAFSSGDADAADAADAPAAATPSSDAPSPPPSPSRLRLGVPTSPRAKSLGPDSPGSPLAAIERRHSEERERLSKSPSGEKNQTPSATRGDDPARGRPPPTGSSRAFAVSRNDGASTTARGFNIDVGVGASGASARLARVYMRAPFPRFEPGEDVEGVLEFFGGATSASSETDADAARAASASLRCAAFSASLETRELVARDGISEPRGRTPLEAAEARGDVAVVPKAWAESPAVVVADLSRASFALTPPADAPPSFETPRAALRWTLRFEFTFYAGEGEGGRGAAAATTRAEWAVPIDVRGGGAEWGEGEAGEVSGWFDFEPGGGGGEDEGGRGSLPRDSSLVAMA